MAPGGAPSSGCLLLYEHFGNTRTAKTFFLAPSSAPWRSAPGALRALHCGLQRPPAARHLSGEARRSRNRGPAASLARRGSPGPLREQRSTHHEHATRLGETVCSRCAARLVQYHTPVNLIVNIIKGSHRRERAVAFTSYCKPEKHLKDRFAAQNPLCSF